MSETTEGADTTRGCICGGRGPSISAMLRMMMPSDTASEHFRNGTVEFLKAFRELLDQRIRTMSETQTKGTRLNVE